jgi:hypothetical protein
MGRVYVHRFFKSNTLHGATMKKHCHRMRMPGAHGIKTPVIDAEGLLGLIAVLHRAEEPALFLN